MVGAFYKNRASVMSHIGQIRPNHEDNFFMNGDLILPDYQGQIKANFNPKITSKNQTFTDKAIFTISDGMGGHNAGEVASFIAVRKLSEYRNHILAASTIEEAIERYQYLVEDANSEIVMKSNSDESNKGMGATLSTLIIHQDRAVGVHLGDSRIYHFQLGQLARMTKDHTEGQRMLDLNLLTESEVESFKSRKDLTRYLGIDDENLLIAGEVTSQVQINRKAWFLLCSDGLTDIINDEQIQCIITEHFENEDIDLAVRELVHHALEGTPEIKGGTDNITVMIVEIIPE